MTALEELISLAKQNPNPTVAAWKNEGKKIVGYWCSYIPRELLHAAGLFPYRIKGVGAEGTTRADVYMAAVCNCSYSRAILDLALNGTYDFLDGLIGMNECDHGRRAHEIWVKKKGVPFDHFLFVPHKSDDMTLREFEKELLKLKVHLESRFHTFVTDENLLNSIRIYNENRALLKSLQENMQENAPRIKGSEMHDVVVAGESTPPEQYNRLLRRLAEELENRPPLADYRARIFIYGWTGDDSSFYKIVEDVGGLVVADNCCFGTREFWDPIHVDGDPLSGLAASYLNRLPCPRMIDGFNNRFQNLQEMASAFRVDGILVTRQQFCDLHGVEAFFLKKREKELGVPFSAPLIQEYVGQDAGRLKTRIEAFIEQLER